jgi:hypothetical protein
VKRPIGPGTRVVYYFWNEVTATRFGRDQDNPFVHTGTVTYVARGKARVQWDDQPEPTLVPVRELHRANHLGEGITFRAEDNRDYRGYTNQDWQTYHNMPTIRRKLSFRQYLRRHREHRLRYDEPMHAQARLRIRAEQYRLDKQPRGTR